LVQAQVRASPICICHKRHFIGAAYANRRKPCNLTSLCRERYPRPTRVGAVCLNYVWPRIRELPLHAAVRPILHLHLFRYIGLAFFVPGVVGPNLQAAFAAPAAYGDLGSLALAWVALMMGSSRYSSIAIWTFSVWGFADLLFAYYQGAIGVGIEPASLGAAWFIPTVIVPLLLWTHVLVFAILLRTSRSDSFARHAAH
jgi:hypothetical protein